MVKYELVTESGRIERKDERTIKPGCVCEQTGDRFPEILKSFDNKVDALNELKNCQSYIREVQGFRGSWYEVEEYYVQENEYDDEVPAEWINGGDIWEFSNMIIRIVDEDGEDLAVVNNMSEALRIQDEYYHNNADVDIEFN